jgi:transposase
MRNRYGSVAYGGMDVHRKFSTVTLRDAEGRVVSREQLNHEDRQKMREHLGRWPAGTPLVMEASFGWPWVSDEVEAAGHRPMLSNCYKLEQMRKARGQVKTNAKDADLLSLLPAEPTRWWEVWRASPEVRDLREWMRHRADLVLLQTEVKNRVHALLARHGVFHPFTDLFGSQGRAFLHRVCQDGRYAEGVLPPGTLEAIRSDVRVLLTLRAELATITWRLRGRLVQDPLVRRLKTIPGIGLILAHVLASEVGVIERFRSHRHLASYACLAPRSDDTGEADPKRTPLGRHLGDRGNRTLKWAFVQAAHGAVRHGGRWRAMYDRHTAGGTKNRGRGYVKVARQLVKVAFVVWSRNVDYTETPPARPGSRATRRKKDSRPGTGQPLVAMVQAKGLKTSL